jgi:hypothetical protein
MHTHEERQFKTVYKLLKDTFLNRYNYKRIECKLHSWQNETDWGYCPQKNACVLVRLDRHKTLKNCFL